jgi:hypothetical protein
VAAGFVTGAEGDWPETRTTDMGTTPAIAKPNMRSRLLTKTSACQLDAIRVLSA